MRDVIAVFSQSQLHCLGLALFLARAEHEGLGFIVLDDPVLSSDEDYRVHFNSTVLTELLKLPMQVIILTQDHDTWEELETRYRHMGISTAQLFIETPAEGAARGALRLEPGPLDPGATPDSGFS
jgi:wobble nucleotide-excising tRNase